MSFKGTHSYTHGTVSMKYPTKSSGRKMNACLVCCETVNVWLMMNHDINALYINSPMYLRRLVIIGLGISLMAVWSQTFTYTSAWVLLSSPYKIHFLTRTPSIATLRHIYSYPLWGYWFVIKSQDYVNGTTLKNTVWDVEIRQLINEVSIYQEMTLKYILSIYV